MPRRSDGYEFAELRAYVEGDDPRRIDWAATARAGAVQTRVVFEDHALTLVTAIDPSPSMAVGRHVRNRDLAWEAARFWYAAAIDDDRCARVQSDGFVFPRAMQGRAAAHICARPDAPTGSSTKALLEIALATVPRDAALLVVSDFLEDDGFVPLLAAATARFDLTILYVRDPWHDGLPLDGFVRLRDAENGSVVRLFVGRAERERYRIAVERRERTALALLGGLNARVAVLDERGAERAFAEAFAL